MPDLPHLQVRTSQRDDYASPRGGGTSPAPRRDRAQQAAKVQSLISTVRADVLASQQAGAAGAVVVFQGPGLSDVASRLQDVKAANRLLATAADDTVIIGSVGNFDALEKKVDEYRTGDTKKGRPRNEQLVARIEFARIATIADLSSGELLDEDITPDGVYFVELWLDAEVEPSSRLADFRRLLERADPGTVRRLGDYQGVDRHVILVAVRGALLLDLPRRLNYLAEVHRPAEVVLREAANAVEFSSGLPPVLADPPPEVAVAVHDTGIDSLHPLIEPLLLGAGVAEPAGSEHDWNGHGTKMAGLAAYGDLAPQVLEPHLTPTAALVSVTYLRPGETGDVLWAERTRLAIDIADEIAGDRPLVHNISMGAVNPREHEATSWSVAVDRAAWNGGQGRLIVVAAGNSAPSPLPADYPASILAAPMSQPAQAWNAITVAGVTDLDVLSAEDLRLGAQAPAARRGQLSPFSTAGPARLAPSKPDVVAEAGNTAPDGRNHNAGLIGLSVLTTASRVIGSDLTRTNATSAAAALTSNALARIWAAYPNATAATVKGLLAHGSTVPEPARQQVDAADHRRALGHGRISWQNSIESQYQRPTLVYEGALRPKHVDLDRTVHREAVFVALPFPADVLNELGDADVQLDVTLSYFVEPSEAERRTRYAGARLRWDMQGPNETDEEFRARVNQLARDDAYVSTTRSYAWAEGADTRSRSTLQRDSTTAAASAFAGERLIAVYPVLGWWDKRQGYENRQLGFSLVVSIAAVGRDVDLYTPLSIALNVPIELEIDAVGEDE